MRASGSITLGFLLLCATTIFAAPNDLQCLRDAIEDLMTSSGDVCPGGQQLEERLRAPEVPGAAQNLLFDDRVKQLRQEALLANPAWQKVYSVGFRIACEPGNSGNRVLLNNND